MADLLGISQSQYNRRENGVSKITKKEWGKMAKVLDTTLEEIYEPEDGVYVIQGDYAHGNFEIGGTFNSNSDFIFNTMKKYIKKLEEENRLLKKENQSLNVSS